MSEELEPIVEYMLTTIDNPFNPFTQFDEWYAYDVNMGYNTSSYLARIAKVPENLDETEAAIATEHAIDEIVRLNLNGNYRKVSVNDFNNKRNNKFLDKL